MNNFVFPKAFAIKLYDIVSEYLKGYYADDDVMAFQKFNSFGRGRLVGA